MAGVGFSCGAKRAIGVGLLGLTCAACGDDTDEHGVKLQDQTSGLTVANGDSSQMQDVEGPIDLGAADPGTGMQILASTSVAGEIRATSAAELAALEKAKAAVPAGYQASSTESSWRDELRAAAISEPEGARVKIVVALADPAFPWHELRNKGLSDADRAQVIDARVAQLKVDLDALESKLVALGGLDTKRFWITPAIAASVPASALTTIADWPELTSGGRDDAHPTQWLAGYTPGYEGRTGMRDTAFVDAGYTGVDGHAYTSANVRLAVADSASLAWRHYGFTYGPFTRFVKKLDCGTGTCVNYTPTEEDSHGTGVTGIAGGSIEAGQDPAYPDPTDRKKRSGISSGVDLYYYTDSVSSNAARLAIMQQSTTDAIDVMNHSYWWGWFSLCCNNCDDNGWNAALRNSTNAGTLHVIAAGNLNVDNVACTVPMPAPRRDALAIGALNTVDSAALYDNVSIWPNSSRGGMDVVIGGTTYSRVASLVDLVAPGCYEKLYGWTGGSSTYSAGTGCGTSYAAPSIAGSIALAKHSFYALGISGMTPRLYQAHMLMMGSGWGFDYGGIKPKGMDWRSGAGRFRNYYPSSANLTPPWGWGCHEATLSNGQTKSYTVGDAGTESTLITTWKSAMTWREDDYTNAADLDLSVWNVCPRGGGQELMEMDAGRDFRERIRLVQSQIGGRCLEYRIVAYYIPSGQTRTFQVCDYFQSGLASDH